MMALLTGGPEVIAKLLSDEETSSSDSTNTSMTSESGADTNVFHTKELDVTKHTLKGRRNL